MEPREDETGRDLGLGLVRAVVDSRPRLDHGVIGRSHLRGVPGRRTGIGAVSAGGTARGACRADPSIHTSPPRAPAGVSLSVGGLLALGRDPFRLQRGVTGAARAFGRTLSLAAGLADRTGGLGRIVTRRAPVGRRGPMRRGKPKGASANEGMAGEGRAIAARPLPGWRQQ